MGEIATTLSFSANESELLGMRVGRCVSADFDDATLLARILEGQYDICRLTAVAGDEFAVSKLERMGLPYYYSGSITRYKTRVSDLPERNFIHNDLEYEPYDGTQQDLLLRLLIGTWGSYPIGYYRTPFLRQLISKEQEIVCVCEFYKKHNLQRDYPNNTIMFIRHKENYVGFFALNIIDDRLESHIGGIVEPYREAGYFFDMQEYIRRFCLDHRLTYFCFGARNENRRVNGIFQQYGYRAVDADNVFHLVPMLSYSARTSGEIFKDSLKFSEDNLETQVLNIILRNHNHLPIHHHSRIQYKLIRLQNIKRDKYTVYVSTPVLNESECLLTIKLSDESGNLIVLGYYSINN